MSGASSASSKTLLTCDCLIPLYVGDLGEREYFARLTLFLNIPSFTSTWRGIRPRLGCAASPQRGHAASVGDATPLLPVRGMGTQWRQ